MLTDPEMKLLLAACVPSNTDNADDMVSVDFDWNKLVDLAEQHRVLPLLHSFLRNAISVPDKIAACNEKAFIANAARNAVITQHLLRISGLLSDNGISALPYKGPVLAQQVYADTSMRIFDDLDFLMAQEDIRPAAELLLKEGFEPYIDLSEKETAAHVRAGWGITLKSRDYGFFVELDSNVGAAYLSLPLDFSSIAGRSDSIDIDGQELKTVGEKDLIVLLCAHGSKHAWCRLSWISDLAALLAQTEVNLKTVLDRAEGLGAGRMVLAGLQLCRLLWQIPLPDRIVSRIHADNTAISMAAEYAAGLVETGGRKKMSHMASLRRNIAMRERMQDKVRCALLEALTPGISDWRFCRLPTGLFWMYYLLRPVRMLLQGMTR